MSETAAPRTFAISPPDLSAEVVLAWAEAAVTAGVDAIQLRAKHLTSHELLALALALRRRIPAPTLLSVNGRLDVALAAGADGLHLPSSSVPVEHARRLAPGLLIGKSAHTLEEVRAVGDAGADYAFFSPVFPPASKASSVPPVGLDGLEAACRTGVAVIALGGMTTDRFAAVRAAGAVGVAGIGAFRGEALVGTVDEAHRLFSRRGGGR